MLTATTNNWSNCTVLCVKKGRIIGKDKLIFLHDNVPSHTSTMVQNYLLETLNWEVPSFTHQTWHLLIITYFRRSATRSLSGTSILRRPKTSENGLMNLPRKMRNFFGIHKLPERWEKCIVSEGKYFEYIYFCFLGKKMCFSD